MKYILAVSFLLLGGLLEAQVLSIADVQGSAASSPYRNQEVTIRGAVTGVYSDGFFVRDNIQEWSGIFIYDPSFDPMPRLGDTVQLTGLVDEYYNMTEIKDVSAYEVISSGNPAPEPVLLTADEIGESYESCLIRIEEATCTNADLGYGEWMVNDGTGSLMVNDLGVPYSPVLGEVYTLTGNLAYSFGDFKIEPRFPEDILIASPVYFTLSPEATLIEQNQVGISWSTNTESTTEIQWGFTPDLEEDPVKLDGTRKDHTVAIGQLDPSTIIYARPFSVLGADTTSTRTGTYSTASESSGEMRVAFNRTYTDLLFDGSGEVFTHDLADTIIRYIENAQQTLDIAFYDFTGHAAAADGYSSGIAEAIYQAASRGVLVRLITDADVADAAPGGEGTEIPRLEVNHDGIMHHKFMVVDHESIDNSWVLTGSTNPNYNNLVIDFNNIVAIQDKSLAKAFLLEFNEMWGGEGEDDDPALYRTGALKTDNSPHRFMINGTLVELFFSPSDPTTKRIADLIRGSESSVDFSVMAFTEDVLGDAVAYAGNNGSVVRGIIDYVEYSGSEFDYLTGLGLDVLDYVNPDGSGWPNGPTLHHKFAVIDGGTDAAALITGSHNWTASAESRNDENTLIIHSQEIAALFLQEHNRIRSWLEHPPVQPDLEDDYFKRWNEDPLLMPVLDNDLIEGVYDLLILKEPDLGTLNVREDGVFEYFPGEAFGTAADSISYGVRLTGYPAFSDSALVIIEPTPEGVAITGANPGISIRPNPGKGVFYVSLPSETGSDMEVMVTDLSGRDIQIEKQLSGSMLRLVLRQPPGTYLLLVSAKDRTFVERLLIVQ
jgi:phosphatidylserine/phosphatidylglycerophosphate/cardiolipin synthase-like enzyme